MELTEKHAEFVGLHFGDGSLIWRRGTDRLRFQLRGDAKEDKPHYDQFVIQLCNEIISPFSGRKVCTILDKKLNSFGVSTESNKIKPLFDSLGIPIGEKKELAIPDWILCSETFSKAFVRGLFDTDGGISYKRNNTAKSKLPAVGVIKISSTSGLMIEGTSKILSGIGLKHYVTFCKKNNGEKDYYKLELFRPHHKEFMRLIGSHNPKHISKFQVAEKFGFCPTKTTFTQRTQILKGLLDPFSLLKAGVG